MAGEQEFGTKMRLLMVMRALLEQPYRYTKKELARRFKVDPDTIKSDFEAFKNAGFDLDHDKKTYRYAFKADKPYEELKSMLDLSEADQLRLLRAISEVEPGNPEFEQLKRRLASLIEYAQKEHNYLRRPYLTKVNLLEKARLEKRRALLVDYHSSNSNVVADRLVEPFYAKAEDDILQAFDVDKKKLRHFRFSRMKRIRLTDTPWAYEKEHKILATDPFRIVDDQQVMVHLRLRVGAYNELVERFPLSKAYIQEDAADEGIYDFQARVNHKFYGLTNFILGFHHQIVEVLEPEELKAHLRREVGRMKF
ncbi:MAG: WYL domain-containing protein [Lewinellaceae bacterium]|nr:WYL domain-containing protein [Lewinellaceae bacterium]